MLSMQRHRPAQQRAIPVTGKDDADLSLREVRQGADFFVEIDEEGRVTVTNRRSMPEFYQLLVKRLQQQGVTVKLNGFDRCNDNWP